MTRPEYVTLKSREDVSIRVESKILEKSVVLDNMINGMLVCRPQSAVCSEFTILSDVDEEHAAEEIPVPNVTEPILRKVDIKSFYYNMSFIAHK